MKKAIALLVTLVILLGSVPAQVFAAETVNRTVIFHAEGATWTRQVQIPDGNCIPDDTLQKMTELIIADIADDQKKIYGWCTDQALTEPWDPSAPVVSDMDLYADLDYSVKGFLNAFYDREDEWGIAYFGNEDGTGGATLSQKGVRLISGGNNTVVDIQRVASDTYRLIKIPDTGIRYAEYYDAKIADGKIQWLRRTFKDYNFSDTEETFYPAYQVWFNNWGGYATETSPQFLLVSPGSKVSKPADPIKPGYRLRRWCTDLDRTLPYDFSKTVNKNIEIYALWEFPISFDLNLPEKATATPVPATIADIYFPEGRKFDLDSSTADPTDDLPAEPTLTGYTFTGWYLDKVCETPLDLTGELTAPVTLYASWEKSVCVVDFDMQGHGTKPAALKVGYDKPIRYIAALPSDTAVEDGVTYYFEGWYYDANFTRRVNLNAPVTSNLTLYAHWTKEITITYKNDWHGDDIVKKVPGGSLINSATVVPSTDYDLDTFGGWFTDPDCTESFPSGWVCVTEDLTLYAKWYEYSSVYFIGYDFGNPSKHIEMRVPYGSQLTEPEALYFSDMEVYGWYTADGKLWNFAEDRTPEGTLTLTAKWGNVFRVGFDPNNGEGATIVEGYRPGDKISVSDVPRMTVPEGKVFAGWFTDAALTKFFDISSATIPADAEGAFSLYGKWSDACTITIHFDESNVVSYEVPVGAPLGNSFLKERITACCPSGSTAYGWYTDAAHRTVWHPDTDNAFEGLQLYPDVGLTQGTLFKLLEGSYYRPFGTRSDLGLFFEGNGIGVLVDYNDWEYERVRATDKTGPQTYRMYCSENKSLNSVYYDLTVVDGKPSAISIKGGAPAVFLGKDMHRCVGVYLNYEGGRLGVKAVGCRFFESGDKFTLPSEDLPYNRGGRFAGWCTDKYAQNLYDADTTLTEDLELFARWIGIPCRVWFCSNMPCKLTNEYVTSGSLLTKPNMNAYEYEYRSDDLEIKGWYLDGEAAQIPWDFSRPVYADMEIYVYWGAREYTLTYEMNGHGTAPESVTYTAHTKIPAPADPTDEGYEFCGWYKDEAFVFDWSFDDFTHADNMTLYAKWKAVVPEDVIGDVNGDGTLSILDVTALLNYIATNDPQYIVAEKADVNEDGVCSIRDVTTLLTMISET